MLTYVIRRLLWAVVLFIAVTMVTLETFDLPMIQGVVVFSTLCIIVFNVMVDVAYAFIDPRIRLQ